MEQWHQNAITTKYFAEWISDVSLNYINHIDSHIIIKLYARDHSYAMEIDFLFWVRKIISESKTEQNKTKTKITAKPAISYI